MRAIIVVLFVMPWLCAIAYAQNVNQWFDVQPGTRLIITQNGATLMSRSVLPGHVHVVISYGGGMRPHARR